MGKREEFCSSEGPLFGPRKWTKETSPTREGAHAARRRQAKELKNEARKVRNDLKNKKRRRARVINRLRHLDTASVLQALTDRGLDLSGGKPAAAPAPPSSASSSGEPR